MALYSRIANVLRKPVKCPVWDIVYGTGDMTEVEFLYQYRKNASMGGDRLPRRPPMWECCCGCMRFRKVNADGTDAKVKLKMLKDMRPAPLTKSVGRRFSAAKLSTTAGRIWFIGTWLTWLLTVMRRPP